MEMPKPGPQHAALQVFAGTWEGTERMPPSQWVPEEITAEGRVVNRSGPGGFSVIQDYVQSGGGSVRFEGHGVLMWDAEAEEYCLYWSDSIGGPMEEFRGNVEGNTWSFVSIQPRGRMRSVWTFEGPDRYRHEMATSPDGKDWAVMMAGAYRKVGD